MRIPIYGLSLVVVTTSLCFMNRTDNRQSTMIHHPSARTYRPSRTALRIIAISLNATNAVPNGIGCVAFLIFRCFARLCFYYFETVPSSFATEPSS